MELRTEIDIPAVRPFDISHGEEIVMLGSCFTDNIGQRLERDGFSVTYNPMGPLYNPASVALAIELAKTPAARRRLITRQDAEGRWHCLNFAARFLYDSREEMESDIHERLDDLGRKLDACSTIFITLGTAYVFATASDGIVGNCHKFPASTFERRRLSVAEAAGWIRRAIELAGEGCRTAFTISPIRHTADGLHGNQLSKATLHLALDEAMQHTPTHYFPAYEIVVDDLRDYRFYADDMKHPSSMAADYIYEVFAKYYMTPSTIAEALRARKQWKRSHHRPIIT